MGSFKLPILISALALTLLGQGTTLIPPVRVIPRTADASTGPLCFNELRANGIEQVCIAAPDAIPSTVTLKLPNNSPTGLLFNDGAGNLSWTPAASCDYDIRNFGAVEGGGDDTAAIQAAVDAAEAAGGGTVCVPVGTWNLSGLVTINGRVFIRGDGEDKSFLVSDSDAGVLLFDLSGLFGALSRHAGFGGLTIAADSTNSSLVDGSLGTAVIIKDANVNFRAENFIIKNHYRGIFIDGGFQIHLRNFVVWHFKNAGVYIDNGVLSDGADAFLSDFWISNLSSTGTQDALAAGILVHGWSGLYATNGAITSMPLGVYVIPLSSQQVFNTQFTNVQVDTCSSHGFAFDSSAAPILSTQLIGSRGAYSGHNGSSFTGVGHGLFIANGTNLDGLTVTGGAYRENGGAGMSLTGKNITITGTEIARNSQTVSTFNNGIETNPGTDHLLITGNRIGNFASGLTNQQAYGIAIFAGTNITIVGNDLSNNSNGRIFDSTGNASVWDCYNDACESLGQVKAIDLITDTLRHTTTGTIELHGSISPNAPFNSSLGGTGVPFLDLFVGTIGGTGDRVTNSYFVDTDTSGVAAVGTGGFRFNGGNLQWSHDLSAWNNFATGGSGPPFPDETFIMASDAGITIPEHRWYLASSSGTSTPVLALRKSRGTVASPATITNGEYLGALTFNGYTGSNFVLFADIITQAESNTGEIIFRNATGGGFATERWRMDRLGDLIPGANEAQDIGSQTRRMDIVWGRRWESYDGSFARIVLNNPGAGSNSGSAINVANASGTNQFTVSYSGTATVAGTVSANLVASTTGYQVNGITRIDSSGNGNFASLQIGGVTAINSSRQWATSVLEPTSGGGSQLGQNPSFGNPWGSIFSIGAINHYNGTTLRAQLTNSGILDLYSIGGLEVRVGGSTTAGGFVDVSYGFRVQSNQGIAPGSSQVLNVRNAADTGSCTITVRGGIITATTC